MYLRWIHIYNYRNLHDTEMTFHEDLNYFVGENAIGKSNFLDLLDYISRAKGFEEADFASLDRPIRIDLRLQWELPEYQSRSPEGTGLRIEQLVQEVYPRVYEHTEAGWEPCSLATLRHIVYICHKDMSERELYDISPSVFEGLSRLMLDKLSDRLRSVVEGAVVTHDSMKLSSIEPSTCFSMRRLMEYLEVAFADDLEARYSRDNVRLVLSVALKLIIQIYQRFQSVATNAESLIISDDKGRRFLPIFISIDEPEIHLSPYLQRAVLSYYYSLVTNRNSAFLRILKDLFNLDGLQGQVFVVTHSTDALIDDYRNIIRLYRGQRGQVVAACGVSFSFAKEVEKHLIMHFPEAKEALYAHAVILVEGETEYGSFRNFGRTIGIDFDYYGICLINARGEASISKLGKLFRSFGLPTVALYDRDVIEKHGTASPNVFYTDEPCFEMELVSYLIHIRQRDVLTNIIKDLSDSGRGTVTTDMLRRSLPKLGIRAESFSPRRLEHISDRDREALRIYYFAWFYTNKGVIVGRRIAKSLTDDMIPPSFCRVIERARQLAVGIVD